MDYTEDILYHINKAANLIKAQRQRELKEAHEKAFTEIARALSDKLYKDFAVEVSLEDIVVACENVRTEFEISRGNIIAKQVNGNSRLFEKVNIFILFDGIGFRAMIDRTNSIKNNILTLLPF